MKCIDCKYFDEEKYRCMLTGEQIPCACCCTCSQAEKQENDAELVWHYGEEEVE